MQSQLEILLQQQLPQLYASHGVGGAYAGADGTSISPITLRIDREEPVQINRENRAGGELQKATIWVMQSDVTKPAVKGRFSLVGLSGPEVWTVETTPILFAGEFECTCTRSGTERVMERRARE